MADTLLGERAYPDIALDLLKYVVERMLSADKPHAEKDVIALYERCKSAVYRSPN